MKNKITFGKASTETLLKGINLVYDAVAPTMGAAGKNVIYRSFFSRNPMVTNDGVSIAMMIDPEDEGEAMGADLMKQAARRTNDDAGDGTSTAIVLSKAIIEKGIEMVEAGANPMVLKKEISDAVKKVVAELKKRAKPIKTDEELFNIANLSMENPEVAKIIAESVKKVGVNGTVVVEESNGISIEKEEIEGIKFDKGYVSMYMATDPQTMNAVLEDVHVLVTDKSFNLNNDLFPLLEELHRQKVNKLFIIAENIQGELLGSIIANRAQNVFYCVGVSKPNDPDVLEDIAILTGAENLTSEKLSGGLVPMHFNSLGKARKIIVSEKSTLIIGGHGNKEKIEDRIKAIKTQIKETESQYKKEALRERLAKLVGGLVILKVGAPTEADMRYTKLKVDDAVAATKAAMEEGVVMGGGKTLYEISLAKTTTLGEEIVAYACQQPIRQIIKNAGFDPDAEIAVLSDGDAWNALTGKMTHDPIGDGIIDPAKVERIALENAASLGGVILTSHAHIAEIPKKQDSPSVV